MAQKEYQRQWYLRKKAGLETNTRHIGKHKCEICGKWFERVGSHVTQVHGMTAREYRKEFGFDLKKGQTSDEYKEIMREHVHNNETIKNLEKGAKYRFKKGDKVGTYERSEQTMERLKNHWVNIAPLERKRTPRKTITCEFCGNKKEVIETSDAKYCNLTCANRDKIKKKGLR